MQQCRKQLDREACELFLFRSHSRSRANDGEHKRLNVIDFGGNIGFLFYASASCRGLINSWNVVEVPKIVNQGMLLKSSLIDSGIDQDLLAKLTFHRSIDSIDMENSTVAVIINGVVMHLEDPRGTLSKLIDIRPLSLFLGNNFEINSDFYDLVKKVCGVEPVSNDYIIVQSGPIDAVAVKHKYSLFREHVLHNHILNYCSHQDLVVLNFCLSKRREGSPRINYSIDDSSGTIKSFVSVDNNYNASYFFA